MTRNVVRKLASLIAVFVALVQFASAAGACEVPQRTMSSGAGVVAACATSAGEGADVCMVRCPSAEPAFVTAADFSADQFAASPAGAVAVPAAVAVMPHLAPPASVLPALSLNLLYRNFRN